LNKYTSKRVAKAEKVAKSAQSKYGDNISSTGHSLGQKVAEVTAKTLDVKNSKVVGYNGGASPLDIPKNIYNKVKCSVSNSNECKKLKNVEHNLTVVDPISISNLTAVGKKNIVKPKMLNTHSIDNFKQH
jgi:hypothetical protein